MITWPEGDEFGIHDDLVGGVADEGPIALQRRDVRFDRQGIPARIDVDRAVVEGPGCSAVSGDQEADAGRARVPLAGGGDDDCLVDIVVRGEDGDAADVDRVAGPEVGE